MNMNQLTLNQFFTLPEKTEDKYYKTKREDMLKQINNFEYSLSPNYNFELSSYHRWVCPKDAIDTSNLDEETEISDYINWSGNQEFKKLMIEKLFDYSCISAGYGLRRIRDSPILSIDEKKEMMEKRDIWFKDNSYC
jgi:hypothetical protein